MSSRARQTAAIDFDAGSAGDDATHIVVMDALTGGNKLWDHDFSNNPDALTSGEFYQLAAQAITLNQTNATGETNASSRRALEGKIDGSGTGIFLAPAEGDGAGDIISGITRVNLDAADFTFTTF